MLSDHNTWQMAYRLVHFLHRNPDVVEDIMREALQWLSQIRRRQHRRPEARDPVRPRVETSEAFFQLSLFETSERWEKAEELRAAPKPSMLLGRYIKHCVWRGLGFADSRYTAFGLGCLLYDYKPRQVGEVFCITALDHADRVVRDMKKWLEVRFEHIVSLCPQALSTRVCPTAGERELIEQALILFTPWGTVCPYPVDLPPDLDSLLAKSEELPHHVLIHPACAGIAQSVRARNCYQAKLPENRRELFPDPDTILRVPMFTEDRDKNDFDGSSPPELSDQELEKLKRRIIACLPSTQQRRREPHFLTFRVCADGQELGQFTPEARMLSLAVPASALRLQIFGQDAEGELPLALFYLPDFLEEATPQRLYAVLEGGATFEVVVTPVVEQDGTMTAGRVDLQFWAEEVQVLKTPEWYEAAVTAAGLSVEIARLAGDQPSEAALLARLGGLHQAQDQPADALAYWQASVALARHLGDKELEAVLSAKLAEANTRQGLFGRLTETIKRFPAMVSIRLRSLARNAYRRFFGARSWNHAIENPASIRSSVPPDPSVEGNILAASENRGIILRCLYENWPDEVSMIGDDSVARIVTEVLLGNRPVFRVPQGGFSFDLTPYIDTILHATILLVSMAQLYIRVRHMRSHNTLNASDEGEAPDGPEETVEELVRILTQHLTEELAVEPREATNLAHMFIRVNRGGHI